MIDFSVIIGGITKPSLGGTGNIFVFSSDDKNHTESEDENIELIPNSIHSCSSFDSHLSERDVIQSSSLWNFSLSHVLTLKDEDQLSKIFSQLGADLTTPRLTTNIFAGDSGFRVDSAINTGIYHVGTEEIEITNVDQEESDSYYCEFNRAIDFTRRRHFGSLGSYGMPITSQPIFWIGRDVYVYVDGKLFRHGVLAENPKVNANEISFSVAFDDALLNSDLLGTRQDNICRLDEAHYYKIQSKQPYVIKKLASNPISLTYDAKNQGFILDDQIAYDIASSEILSLDAEDRLPKDYFTASGIFTSDRQQWWTGVSDIGNYTASFHFYIDESYAGLKFDDFYSESNITQSTSVMLGFSLFWPAPSITLAGGDIWEDQSFNLDQIKTLINTYGVRSEDIGANYRDFVLRWDDSRGFYFASTFKNVADPWIEIGILTQENIPFSGGTLLNFTRRGWVDSLTDDQKLIQESTSVISDIPLNWRDSNLFLSNEMNIPESVDYLQPFQGGVGTLTSEVYFSNETFYEPNELMYSKEITQQETLPKVEIYPWRVLGTGEQIERKWFNYGYLGSEEFDSGSTKESIHWFKMPSIRAVSGSGNNYQMKGFKQNVSLPIPLTHAEKWVNDYEFYLCSQDLEWFVSEETDLLVKWQELKNGGSFESHEQRLHVINRSTNENKNGYFAIRRNAARNAFNYRSFGEWTSQGGEPVSLIPILPIVTTLNNDNINEILCSVDGSGSNLYDSFVQGFGIDPNNVDTISFNSFASNWLKNYDLDQLRQKGFEALEGILHLSSLCIRSISQDGYKLQLASLATPTYNQVKCEFNDDNILTFPTNVTQLPVVSQYLISSKRNGEDVSIKIVDGLALACNGTGEELSLDLTLGDLADNIQDNEDLRSKLFSCHMRYGEPHQTISLTVALDANPYFLYLSCGDVVYLNSEILTNKLNLSPRLGQITSVKIDVLKKQASVNIFLWSQYVKGWQPSFAFSQSGTRVKLQGANRIFDFLPNSASVSVVYGTSYTPTTATDTYTKTNERGVYTSNTSRNASGYAIFPDQTGFFTFNDIIV